VSTGQELIVPAGVPYVSYAPTVKKTTAKKTTSTKAGAAKTPAKKTETASKKK
jgi:hypothetical protein